MPILGLGTVVKAASANGSIAKVTGENGIIWQSAGGATEFTLATAVIDFSVTQLGVITLGLSLGSFEGTNYTNGQNIGFNNGTIDLMGGLRVPTDTKWTNSGELLTIEGITAMQEPRDAAPAVTTNAATSTGSLFTTLNGEITDLHGSTIKSTGFYYIAGDSTTTANEVFQGTKVFTTEAQKEVGTFSIIVSGLLSSTEYHFLAFAESESLGTGYGSVRSLTTLETEAFAFWAYTNDGSPYGGTAGTPTTGAYGAWGGAANSGTTDVTLNDAGKPISARCAASNETCSVSRTRQVSTPYTGGSQDQDGVCVFTAGTQPSGLACTDPAGDEGDTTERTVTAGYNAVTDDVQTASVQNRDYVAQDPEFGFDNLGVTCSIDGDGNITLDSTVDATLTHSPEKFLASSVIIKDREISVSAGGVTIPSGFQEAGAEDQSYSGTCTADQPAQTVLPVPAGILTVTYGRDSTREYTTNRNTLDLEAGTSYSIAVRNTGGTATLTNKVNIDGSPYIVSSINNATRNHSCRYTNASGTSFIGVTIGNTN